MFGEQIKALQTKIEDKLASIEALQTLVEKEDRSFTKDEQSTYDAVYEEIKALQVRKNDMEKTESLLATRAVPATPTTPAAPAPAATPTPVTGGTPVKDADPSLFFAKQAHALFVNGNSRASAAQYAKDVMQDEFLAKTFSMPLSVVNKAAAAVATGQSTVTGWAAELVQIQQAASAFIELLRPMSVVARFPGRSMDFAGNGEIKIPRQTVGSTGSWVGENNPIKVDRLTLDEVSLKPKKNANIITATNELLMRSDPSAMAIIRDDILKGIAISIDSTFTDASAASAIRPAGMQTFDGTPTASGGVTLDLVTADIKAAIAAMLTVNMPMVSPVWLINPLRVNSLRFMRDGLGAYVWKDELSSGVLAGYPVLESTTVPGDIVMLVDANQIVIASELAPEISISEDATLSLMDDGSGAPTASMFQLDAVAIRAKTTLDWNSRYAEAVQVITGVAW